MTRVDNPTFIITDPAEPELGPECPLQCEDGAESHVWEFVWDSYDGYSLTTDECFICERGIQYSDWPFEYLTLPPIKVYLETVLEPCGTYYEPEHNVYVAMHLA